MKRNSENVRKALALALACSLCVGTMAPTAAAFDEGETVETIETVETVEAAAYSMEYQQDSSRGGHQNQSDPVNGTVYVYLNIGQKPTESVTEGTAELEKAQSALDDAKKAFKDTAENMEKADEAVTESKVDEFKTEHEKPDDEEVAEVVDAMPGNPFETGIATAPEFDGNDGSDEESDAGEDSETVVEKTPDQLAAEKIAADKAALEAAEKAANDVISEAEESLKGSHEAAKKALDAYETACTNANNAIVEANKALAAKTDFDNKVKAEIDKLEKPADSMKKPGDQSAYNSYKDYADAVEAYNNWVTACDTYNSKIAEIRASHADEEKSIYNAWDAAEKEAKNLKEAASKAETAFKDSNKIFEDAYNTVFNGTHQFPNFKQHQVVQKAVYIGRI